MGLKKSIYKGKLQGVATSHLIEGKFSFKIDTKIEGLPEELIVALKVTMNSSVLLIREGDKIDIIGEILQEFKGKEKLEHIYMRGLQIYNKTLKFGT